MLTLLFRFDILIWQSTSATKATNIKSKKVKKIKKSVDKKKYICYSYITRIQLRMYQIKKSKKIKKSIDTKKNI